MGEAAQKVSAGNVNQNDLYNHQCIKCGSTELSFAEQAQGFGIGKAAIGALAFGPLGLLAGGINRKKMSVYVRCNKCLEVFAGDKLNQKLKNEQVEREIRKKPVLYSFAQAGIFALIVALLVKAFSEVSFWTPFGFAWGLLSIIMIAKVKREDLGIVKKAVAISLAIMMGLIVSGMGSISGNSSSVGKTQIGSEKAKPSSK